MKGGQHLRPQFRAPLSPAERAEWVRRIAVARDKELDARGELDLVVVEARKAGCSWAVIGEGTQTAAQSARERFQKIREIAEMDGVV